MRSGKSFALIALVLLAMPAALGEGGKMDAAAKEDHGLPIPAGALKNPALGGATTLAPGKNYTMIVYEVGSPIALVAAFYKERLPDAKRAEEDKEIRLSTPEGTIKLAPLGAGTRITLVVGPR